MKNLSAILLLLISFFFSEQSCGQSAGSIENFTLINTVDNTRISLTNFSNKKGIVVVFTSDFCPYSKLYEERIAELAAEFSSKGIQFILINPNNPLVSKDDSIEEMAKNAKAKGYQFPYLADKDQKVADAFGATKTPEVYLLKPSGNTFKVLYRGAIDDNPQVPSDVSAFYLKEAIVNLLSGKPISSSYERPTGCMIKKR